MGSLALKSRDISGQIHGTGQKGAECSAGTPCFDMDFARSRFLGEGGRELVRFENQGPFIFSTRTRVRVREVGGSYFQDSSRRGVDRVQ